jgi:chromosome transmission fidelity protein 1
VVASHQQGPQQGPQQGQQQGLCCEDGRAYYANLCAKAVNQCLGRVIRHRGDWAAVLLADAR